MLPTRKPSTLNLGPCSRRSGITSTPIRSSTCGAKAAAAPAKKDGKDRDGGEWGAFFSVSGVVCSGSGGEILMHPLGVVILTICLTVLLLLSFFGLVLLSCEIACAGYGVLAGVVLFSGAFLFSFFYSLALLHIYKTESSDTDTFVKKSAKAALILILTIALLLAIGS